MVNNLKFQIWFYDIRHDLNFLSTLSLNRKKWTLCLSIYLRKFFLINFEIKVYKETGQYLTQISIWPGQNLSEFVKSRCLSLCHSWRPRCVLICHAGDQWNHGPVRKWLLSVESCPLSAHLWSETRENTALMTIYTALAAFSYSSAH